MTIIANKKQIIKYLSKTFQFFFCNVLYEDILLNVHCRESLFIGKHEYYLHYLIHIKQVLVYSVVVCCGEECDGEVDEEADWEDGGGGLGPVG